MLASDVLTMDPSLRLELWLAKSRGPYLQRSYEQTILDEQEQSSQI